MLKNTMSSMRETVFAIPGDLEALTGGYIYEKELLHGLRRAGRVVHHLALPGSYPTPSPADVAKTLEALRAVPNDRVLLLDGFLTGATPAGGLTALRAPYVAVTHHPLALETGLDPARAAYLAQTERANLAGAAHLVVPSPHTAEVLARDFGVAEGRLTVAPPGVHRPPTGSAPSDPAAPPLILSVGQLVPRKGHDVLMRALATLTDLPWRLEVVGKNGPPEEAAALRHLRHELGLENRVQFAGTLPPDALGQRYAQADIFALATRYEGYGMVFAEALAAGLPIVAGAGGAVPQTVPDTAGLLVPPGDIAATAAALRRLLRDRDLHARLAAGATQAGARLPSWDDTARIVGAVLDRV